VICLDLADQQPARRLEWPDGCKTDLKIRREIEAQWAEQQKPAQQRRDELAELRSANAVLQRRVEALERAMRKRVPTTALIDGLAQGFGQALRAERKEVAKRLDAIEATRMRYIGVYSQGNSYQPGMVVTRSGSSWHCNVATTAVPGQSPDFELMTKAGRDGRDLREQRAPGLK
jgi:hypothetical protein